MDDKDLRHLAAIVRDSDDAIIGKTVDAIITSWNGGAERIYGYTAAEAIGRTFAMLIPPDREDELPKILQNVTEGHGINRYDTLRVTKDGRLVNMSVTISPIRDDTGAITGISSIGRDVTKEKQDEAALKESARAYKLLMEQASDAILVSYPDQPLIEINQRASAMLGYTRDELLQLREGGSDLSEVMSALPLRTDQALEGDIVYAVRTVRRKDGTTIIAELSTRRLDDGRIITIARDITERQLAEEALRESEARLRSAIDLAQLYFYEWNPQTGELTLDLGLKQLWGLPFDTSVDNELFLAGIHPDDRDFVQASLNHSSDPAGDGMYIAEYRVMGQQTHREAWISARGKSFFEGDIAVRHLGVAQDITERKRVEQDLRASEKKFRAIFENTLDAMFITGAEGRFLDVNPAASSLLGLPEEELIGRSYLEFQSLKSTTALGPLQERVAERGEASGDLQFVSANGEVRDVDYFSKANFIPGFHLSVAHDLTERRRAEEALRESEMRYRSLVETSPDAITLTDLQGTILVCNRQTVELHGYDSVEDMLGRNALEMLAPEDHLRAAEDMGRLISTGASRNLEYTSLKRDGSRFPSEINGSIILDSEGKPQGFMSILRDITERRHSEQEHWAREAAEQANRAKSVFLSRMSHELRTPLNAILGFGQLLQMDSTTPEQQESVDYIIKAGRHLLTLINEVLDIARIEEGKLTSSIEPVFLSDVLQESLDLVQPLATHRNITVNADLTHMYNCYVMADHQRLQQVLLNLLVNAIKYNREGGVVNVSCSGLKTTEGLSPVLGTQLHSLDLGPPILNTRIRVAVSDTGLGLSPDKVARLFTPFERLGAEQTDVEGTGLGLAISSHLVGAMGGAIGVESVQGVGSTFWIDLCQADEPVPEIEPIVIDPPLNSLLGERIRTMLYIEDNLSNLRLIERILRQWPGINLITAMQGQMGLDMAYEHRPDLIMLDLHLPDMTGNEVLQRLRDDPRTDTIPVVVLSADANPRQMARLLEAGARAYLTKPFDVKQLLKVLGEAAVQ